MDSIRRESPDMIRGRSGSSWPIPASSATERRSRPPSKNAKAFLTVQKEFGSFDAYIWRFASPGPKRSRWRSLKQIPARSEESDRMSEDLKSRGFKFVGSTICYAYMQAVGMVNDHLTYCFR